MNATRHASRLVLAPLLAAALAAALATSACVGGSETGNPALPTPIALSVHSSEPELVAVSRGTEGSLVTEAWVAIGEARFLGADECARFGDLDVVGDTSVVADLAEPGAVLSSPTPRGERCGLLLPLENDTEDLPDGAPAALQSHSVLLRGERADGTPFELRYPEHDELELAADGGGLEPSAQPLVLSFDVATWLRGVDLDAATPETDGTILIDEAHDVALLERFELNLACSLELFADEDEDGQLSDGEPRLARCAPDGS